MVYVYEESEGGYCIIRLNGEFVIIQNVKLLMYKYYRFKSLIWM